MPELPHVAAFKRYLDATGVGRRVEHTHVRDERVLEEVSRASLAQRLTGRRLAAARRHGKYLGVALDRDARDARHLVFHFAMTGELRRYSSKADEPPYAKLVLDLDDGGHLSFGCRRALCRVRLVEDFGRLTHERDLGPDALDPDLDEEWFLERLRGKSGTLKGALMDQSLLAGIGNEFADEILHQARLHPGASISDIDDSEQAKIWKILREVLESAVEHNAEIEKLPDDWLREAREEGAVCPRCGTALQRSRVAGRSTYYCERCQPAAGSSGSGE